MRNNLALRAQGHNLTVELKSGLYSNQADLLRQRSQLWTLRDRKSYAENEDPTVGPSTLLVLQQSTQWLQFGRLRAGPSS